MTDPAWWPVFRRVVVFLLGVAVILDALIRSDAPIIGMLVVGLLMVGVLPIDDLVTLVRRNGIRRRRDTDEP